MAPVNFTWDINLGHVITVSLALIGLIGAWVTIKVKTSDNEEKTRNLGTRVEAYGIALADLRLHVEQTCVKKVDLDRLDERLDRRFDGVEKSIREMTTTIITTVTAGRPSR